MSNPNPSELGKGAKEASKDEHCLDTNVQLRSGQEDCQPESRVQHRMTKAHSMVMTSSR
jgi:hypothetical protein